VALLKKAKAIIYSMKGLQRLAVPLLLEINEIEMA